MRLAAPFQAGLVLSVRRLFVWLFGLSYFFGGVMLDKLRRQDSQRRQAVRLRRTFSRIGGTFIKFGQQMAVRVDLLPEVYCEELTRLLDRVDPFPTEIAIKSIESCLRQPLSEIFTIFDPEPIGAASIACVYQGVLKSGEKVAVKVRRPGIGSQFAADFRVLRWLFTIPARRSSSSTLSKVAVSLPPSRMTGRIFFRSSPKRSLASRPCRARIQLMLPRSVLISPLCATSR
jgi:predicted unusual protein kinase regulating ubiquinone biosynthesis (AarF/ABC1/UbiB family)